MESHGPILCDFRVDTDMCYPLVGPGKALDDMYLFKERNTNNNNVVNKNDLIIPPS